MCKGLGARFRPLRRIRACPGASRYRAGAVFIDERLLESFSRAVKSFGDLLAQRHEEGRERPRLEDLSAAVVIAKAIRDNLTIGLIAMKVKRLEGQVGEVARQKFSFRDRQQVRLVAEALWQTARESKHIFRATR